MMTECKAFLELVVDYIEAKRINDTVQMDILVGRVEQVLSNISERKEKDNSRCWVCHHDLISHDTKGCKVGECECTVRLGVRQY